MIKIPRLKGGIPAIRAVLGAGINVNVTLIFSSSDTTTSSARGASGIADAYSAGHDVGGVASVASFFVSRVDVPVDALLPEEDPRRGTTSNAQAAAAYELYRGAFEKRKC